ncbi:hypothetical protein AAE478_007383 [Parahypoxylon ruwenzoriense]
MIPHLRTILRFLALTPAIPQVLGESYVNGPFQLRVSSSSSTNTSINGHAYPCQASLGLCFSSGADPDPDPATRNTGSGFVFTSSSRADFSTGYLSYRTVTTTTSNDTGSTASSLRSNGTISLVYDAGSNVAVPILTLSSTAAAQVLGFDAETGNLVAVGINDTAMGTGGAETGSGSGGAGVGTQDYNNWHLCYVQLDQRQGVQRLVAWVLGANLGWRPTNPTCEAVNITMETGAVGYGVGE